MFSVPCVARALICNLHIFYLQSVQYDDDRLTLLINTHVDLEEGIHWGDEGGGGGGGGGGSGGGAGTAGHGHLINSFRFDAY